MKSNWLIVVIALVAILYGAFEGIGIQKAKAASPALAGGGMLQNKIAPDFQLKSLDGKTVKLSDFRGRPVLLNFWATYCAPCRVEMPWLVDLHKQYHPQGLEMLGVSIDDIAEQGAVAQFTKDRNVNYTILLGTTSVADAYGGLRFLPQTLFINREGVVVKSTAGVKDKKDLEDGIKSLLSAGR
jgi:peroxiredoxin